MRDDAFGRNPNHYVDSMHTGTAQIRYRQQAESVTDPTPTKLIVALYTLHPLKRFWLAEYFGPAENKQVRKCLKRIRMRTDLIWQETLVLQRKIGICDGVSDVSRVWLRFCRNQESSY